MPDELDSLTFTPVFVNGRDSNWLLASDGQLVPHIRGGAGEGEGDEGAEGGAEGEGGGGDTKTGDDAAAKATKVEMTQEELDALIAGKVAKERKKAETEAAEAAKREKMDEAERLKAEKEDAERKGAETEAKANAKLVLADAKVAAVEAGVKAERIATFMRLVDLGSVDVDNDGNPDAKAVKAAVAAALKDAPEFKADAGAKKGASGGDMNGDGGKDRPKTITDAVAARMAS